MTLVLLGALLVGLTLGLLGSGGSILTVPVLTLVIGQHEKVAIASSLAIVGGIAAVAAVRAWREAAAGAASAAAGTAASTGAAGGARWVQPARARRPKAARVARCQFMAGSLRDANRGYGRVRPRLTKACEGAR